MHSLFEEEILGEQDAFDHYLGYGTDSYAEALSYVPTPKESPGPERYLELVRSAKEAVDVPVIASLNGFTPGGWTRYADLLQEAGADALELNVFFLPTDPKVTGTEIENRTVGVLRDVRELANVPVAVKLSPYWSATMHMAMRLSDAGANAWCCSTASISRTSTSRNSRSVPAWRCPRPKRPAWACAGSGCCTVTCRPIWRSRAACTTPAAF